LLVADDVNHRADNVGRGHSGGRQREGGVGDDLVHLREHIAVGDLAVRGDGALPGEVDGARRFDDGDVVIAGRAVQFGRVAPFDGHAALFTRR
jgi:hypothetical protein